MSISNSKALLQCTLLAIIVLLFNTNAIAQTINGTASVLDFEKTKGQQKLPRLKLTHRSCLQKFV